ncbi:MAG: LytTR family DNA-binding domain-containing protein [Bacteroidota bacterium]
MPTPIIKVWIIEDEEPAVKRLEKMLGNIDSQLVVEQKLCSIEQSVQAFQTKDLPHLVLMDINLADGRSFEIFKQVQVTVPIIFVTAFDQYAIEAFKVNSIDYLLKPIKAEELKTAIEKFKRQQAQATAAGFDMQQLLQTIGIAKKEYKERFVVKYGEHLRTIDINNIAYFYSENKATHLITKDGNRFIADHNLDQLENMLNPRNFFRINRQFIISLVSIAEMLTWTKARVLVKLNPPTKLDTIVSSERAASFKNWLAGEYG